MRAGFFAWYISAAFQLISRRSTMKPFGLLAVILMSVVAPLPAQQTGAPLPQPAPPGAPRAETQDGGVSRKEVTNWNAEIIAARTATKEGRFADSEALM
jgi:hypothetical protein